MLVFLCIWCASGKEKINHMICGCIGLIVHVDNGEVLVASGSSKKVLRKFIHLLRLSSESA